MNRILSTLCYIYKDDEVLMLYRNKKKNDVNKGKYIGVGGHFFLGESPEECIKREVFEETGLKIIDYKYRGFISFNTKNNEYEYICLFTCDKFSGKLIQCNEGDLMWVKIRDLHKLNLWQGDRIFLKLLMESDEFFSLKLSYDKDILYEAILNGKENLLKK